MALDEDLFYDVQIVFLDASGDAVVATIHKNRSLDDSQKLATMLMRNVLDDPEGFVGFEPDEEKDVMAYVRGSAIKELAIAPNIDDQEAEHDVDDSVADPEQPEEREDSGPAITQEKLTRIPMPPGWLDR